MLGHLNMLQQVIDFYILDQWNLEERFPLEKVILFHHILKNN